MSKSIIRNIFVAIGVFFALSAQATTITIVNLDGPGEGFNSTTAVSPLPGNSGQTLGQQYTNVFRAAADFWEQKLDSSVEIRVQAAFEEQPCTATGAQLGGAGPISGFVDFANVPRANTIYSVAQASSLAGVDLDPDGNDVNAEFNSQLDGRASCLGGAKWWLGIDSPAQGRTISLYDTVLHEIGHGIGFLTFVSPSGARFAGFDDPYMVNLFDQTQNRAWTSMSDAQRQASSVNTGDLVWRGANVAAGAGVFTGGRNGGFLRMFAPNPFQGGSSVSHWDTALSPDELMEPLATPTSNSCATILALKDMGWRTMNECRDGTPVVAPILPLLLDE